MLTRGAVMGNRCTVIQARGPVIEDGRAVMRARCKVMHLRCAVIGDGCPVIHSRWAVIETRRSVIEDGRTVMRAIWAVIGPRGVGSAFQRAAIDVRWAAGDSKGAGSLRAKRGGGRGRGRMKTGVGELRRPGAGRGGSAVGASRLHEMRPAGNTRPRPEAWAGAPFSPDYVQRAPGRLLAGCGRGTGSHRRCPDQRRTGSERQGPGSHSGPSGVYLAVAVASKAGAGRRISRAAR